jgi:putative acetyltransferase
VETLWAQVAGEGEWIGAELPLRPDWQSRFRDAIRSSDAAWFLAERDGLVVGAIFVQNEQGLAHVGMAVQDRYRGQGIGKCLLDAATDWARDRSCHKIALEVWPHNERARKLYERAGFTDEGYLRRHYRRRNGALWDAVAMGLVLDRVSPGRP